MTLKEEIRSDIECSVWKPLWISTGNSADSIWYSIWNSVRYSLQDSIWASVDKKLNAYDFKRKN